MPVSRLCTGQIIAPLGESPLNYPAPTPPGSLPTLMMSCGVSTVYVS